jgi:hypothetical protein
MVVASVLLAVNLILTVILLLMVRRAFRVLAPAASAGDGRRDAHMVGGVSGASQSLSPPDELATPLMDDEFSREREGFNRLKPDLMRTHRGKYVAVYRGEVVAIADSSTEAALQAYAEVGYVTLYVGLVDEQLPVAHIASPQLGESTTEV